MKKERLDKRMVDLALVAGRERARALILAGQVVVNGHTANKAGQLVGQDDEITLRTQDHPYVSRGALKLVHALDHFGIDPTGAVALDVGASTGGFTDVLLRRGAARVYAIDVGYGQLAWSLRQDPRVVVLERENIRYLDPAAIPEPCDLAVIDVSFISLTLILDKVRELLADPGKSIVALIKPQFEAGKDQVGKGGVVRDPAVHQQVIDKIRDWADRGNYKVGPVLESPIRGPAGNIEFLILLRT
jgi:23S rRNA (cytidine1920-2'-O)/16S rRNA (cytidine1409-2'-O)-methyltransferase